MNFAKKQRITPKMLIVAYNDVASRQLFNEIRISSVFNFFYPIANKTHSKFK